MALSGWYRERVLIIGLTPLSCRIVREAASRPHLRYTVVGVLDDGGEGTTEDVPLLGGIAELAGVIERVRPQRVLVALERAAPADAGAGAARTCVARNIVVEDAAEFYERLTGTLAIDSLAPTSLVYCRRFGPSRRSRDSAGRSACSSPSSAWRCCGR